MKNRNRMTIQYASDLHLEFPDNSLFVARNSFIAVGDVLVLAGDIFRLREWEFYRQQRFFDWCADSFRQTLLIPGNHEYYHSDIADWSDSWVVELRDNVKMYQNKVVRIDDVDFILSTMWSHIPVVDGGYFRRYMSDFTLISKDGGPFTIDDYNLEHEKCLLFFRRLLPEATPRRR